MTVETGQFPHKCRKDLRQENDTENRIFQNFKIENRMILEKLKKPTENTIADHVINEEEENGKKNDTCIYNQKERVNICKAHIEESGL